MQYTPETGKALILLQDIEVAGLALAASHAPACAAPSPLPSGSSVFTPFRRDKSR
jgi:hypothetical protein